MRVIEHYIAGKRNAEDCEDGYVITPDYAAVIDGSTSKSLLPPPPCGRSRGQIAMLAVKDFVLHAAPDLDMPEFCEQATAAIRQHYPAESLPDLLLHPEDRYCCSTIVYSRYHNAIWMIGDCQALVVQEGADAPLHLTNEKPEEAILAERRSCILNKLRAEGTPLEILRRNDVGRAAILPALKAAMKGQNRDYAVIDGFDIPLSKVKTHILGPEATEIVLASDGYPHLFSTLAESESYLTRCLNEDPLCINLNKATKGLMDGAQSFDDRTFLRIRVK